VRTLQAFRVASLERDGLRRDIEDLKEQIEAIRAELAKQASGQQAAKRWFGLT
jgi:uncharacterized small protein (DUF1192 family)